MTERSTLINMLLLALLTGVYLLSGSIQCAVDCLARIDDNHAKAVRVVDCHYVNSQPETVSNCPNKACHQQGPAHGSLDGPEVSNLQKLAQPLASTSHPSSPKFKAGSAYQVPLPKYDPILAYAAPALKTISQQQLSLRTTVLLN